jgi:hypothetical protein
MLNNYLYNILEKSYTTRVNNIFIFCGGINKTFKLETKDVTFAILKPSKFNIGFFFIFTS